MDAVVKQELVENLGLLEKNQRNGDVSNGPASVIELSSSSSSSSSSSESDSDDDLNYVNGVAGNVAVLGGERKRPVGISDDIDGSLSKKRKPNELGVILPVGFLDPLPLEASPALPQPVTEFPVVARQWDETASLSMKVNGCKQFWKAGDYEGAPSGDWDSSSVGMDHVRVHPKFLHSNATSHKWALGAFAELLDNSLDEVCYGATYVNVDMLVNKKDGSRMLLIEDNGGGMDPDKMRQCMSLGYSVKSKIANTIGQYGNGFKTSTMRLGADVIVFSRCCGKDGRRPTQSIGLLSYTFLRSTGKEDIVVPLLDYERGGREWNKMVRSSLADWDKNVETIVQWSPFSSEADLLRQFNLMKDHGTRIIIYNLWEDDQGQLELDFDGDPHDIQIRGVNRDEKKIQMAKEFPNSRHFLTYQHSLRSYASILYLRLPPSFRIILRGKDVEHHNIVNDMMMSQEITYRPQTGADGIPKEANMLAEVTIGFVKDAKHHIDVQGFNVYHKNRLIKPFWRLWNAAGSDGRGVIGVLEANFVEPAHDKQGFERTTVLSRLEARLIQMQKNYWCSNCHKIGYAPRRNKKSMDESANRETSPDCFSPSSQSKKKFTASSGKTSLSALDKLYSLSNQKQRRTETEKYSKHWKHMSDGPKKNGKRKSSSGPSSPAEDDVSDDLYIVSPERQANDSSPMRFHGEKTFGKDGARTTRSVSLEDTGLLHDHSSGGMTTRSSRRPHAKASDVNDTEIQVSDLHTLQQLKEENRDLKERLERKEGEILGGLLKDLQCERNKCKSLEIQFQAAQQKIEELNKEQESLIDIFSEERDRRDIEEQNLRKKLQDASNTIQELLDKVRLLEKMKSSNSKLGW